jgi:type VI secretion system secreted protein VgrG
VLGFRERHRLGVPAELDIEVALGDYTDIEDLLGQSAALEFEEEGSPVRRISGVAESAAVVASAQGFQADRLYLYRLHVVSPAALLGRSFGCEIFQELDVQQIVSKVLEEHGIAAADQDWRLSGSYPKREFCVQYQESALAFISRLLEEEGIHFFSEPTDGGADKLVFSDDSTIAEPIAGELALPYRPRTGMHHAEDTVHSIREARRVVSGKFVLRDFNFEKPQLDLTSEASADLDTDLEVYDYPGLYAVPAEGKRLATVKLEAEQAARSTVIAEATSTRLRAGHKLALKDADDADGEYLIAAVSLEYAGASGGNSGKYAATVELVPIDVKYRCPQATPRPIIEGPQTAVIVAPAGSQSEEIHTDKHGRCKVRFHWDLSGVQDDKASCWMRVEQLQTSGSMALPRVGWEFIVDFLEGNPDRPIVAGRLYNGMFMPPYALPEGKTRTSLRTATTPGGGGSNEIRLEDKSGAEEIMIHAQYDTNIAVANNKTKNVGNCETQSVGVNNTVQVGADQSIQITKGCQNTIGADQTVAVGGNRNMEVNAAIGLTVKGSSTTSVGGSQTAMIGSALEAAIALAAEKATEFAAAKASEAVGRVEAAAQGAINQAMGPINALTSKAGALGGAMQAVRNGNLGAVGGLIGAAAGLPGAGAMGAALAPSGGLAALTKPGGQGSSAAGISGGNALAAAAQGAAQKALSKAKNALGAGEGSGGEDGGGESQANEAGPEGSVAGVDATDREKGSGHSSHNVTGSHSETVAALKVVAAASGIMTNVAGSMNRSVGAAHVEIVAGDRAESVEGAKSEQALGLVVITKSDETVSVKGTHTTMVGGAVIQLISGSHSVVAGGPATFIGAFHKIEASNKITFKCGASEVVIDGSGITMKSPLITITAGKIQLPKQVGEVV